MLLCLTMTLQWSARSLLIVSKMLNATREVTIGLHADTKLVLATHKVDGKASSANHVTWSATANDTSVLSVANDASFTGTYMDFEKSGYSTNLNDASFWGFNAAINVVSHSISIPCLET